MQIKGILFDVDGVITDTAKIHYKSWAKVVKKIGIDYTEAENENLRGLPRIDTLKEIIKLKQPQATYELEFLNSLAHEKNELYVELLKQELDETYLLPNIKKFIIDAKNKGIKLAIASSSYNAPFILKKLNVYDYFDAIVNPANVAKGKPAPDIYIQAYELIGVPKEECIGLEDAVSGVESIVGAGVKAIAFDYHSGVDFSKASLVLHDTSELNLDSVISYFKNIN
ncbi:beta-phosphoglucomutase [Mycoplasmopsis pullorum]|uniref:Beta-phosphoglucomutase n=1 Tax=Mycoplasmopsis pullorum TaxID=48003 RepID=A0A1L4FR49_9BACT|nr:beta-phosphoglucomutase [Mycoplasmopsis pullorum]APJ38085.1 beta-phosphoglucomutase [Mycoplasmopsis pullorum]APJ38744.1 beta-phosphoglucomutase [Mycoplasmopsis pullorum]APJ38803.1 beta-phosphoglucomutase [Mycoplasmopsis pullorum]